MDQIAWTYIWEGQKLREELERDIMKRQIGKFIIRRKGEKNVEVPLWGSIWKSNAINKEFWAGVYANIPYYIVEKDMTVIKFLLDMMRLERLPFKLSYSSYQGNDAVSFGYFKNYDKGEFEYLINKLKTLKYDDGETKFYFDITHDMKYVYKSAVVDAI